MQIATIGYPRVGTLRELKFATEKYFEGVLAKEELQDTAALLRKTHWQMHINNGLDFIPANDFSFYDNMLDTAVLLNDSSLANLVDAAQEVRRSCCNENIRNL